MRSNYIEHKTPQFRILSDRQLEELHLATLQIMERAGMAFESAEALQLLADAGADTLDPDRVKIPGHLVEEAIRTAPQSVTFYSRDGEPAFVLNGMTGSHFGSMPDCPNYLDPRIGASRSCYIADIADTARLIDACSNVEWSYLATGHRTIPGAIGDKVSLLQFVLNSSKPVIAEIADAPSLREMIDLCCIVAGGEENLRRKPFFGGSCEPVTPLVQGKDAMEKSLLCAEKGLPVVVYGMQMAGTTTPATLPGCLSIANAEVLGQLVVLQLKNPGSPVIYGGIPTIMDMRTMIYSYGAPELTLMVGALTELCHYYKLPMFGTAGCTDAGAIDAQAGAEITNQILVTMLTGADLVHDVGLMYHGTTISPTSIVLVDQVIEMAKVLMRGIEINEETLPLGLIERLGPKAAYLSEAHTFNHFRNFWAPKVFDRSFTRQDGTKSCSDLLTERAIHLMDSHQPKPLPDDVVKELRKVERTWLDRAGLSDYPTRPNDVLPARSGM